MSNLARPFGLAAPPAPVAGPAGDALAQLAVAQSALAAAQAGTLTAAQLTAAQAALAACADDVRALSGSQIPPGTWISGGAAVAAAAGAGVVGGLVGWVFGKKGT